MTRLRCQLRALALTLPLCLVASSAFADLAPPDDQKQINYAFVVTGTIPADRVVFAYPCGTSSGAPIDEHRVIESGKAIPVGRRGGTCEIYNVAKKDYDDFAKTYTPKTTFGTDPNLTALAAKAQKCSGTPSPLFVIPKADSRNEIVEQLDLTIDATKCTVVSRAVPASTVSASGGSPATSSGSSSPPSGSSGDDSGGCSVGGTAGAAAPWMVALAVPFFVLGARRRRRQA